MHPWTTLSKEFFSHASMISCSEDRTASVGTEGDDEVPVALSLVVAMMALCFVFGLLLSIVTDQRESLLLLVRLLFFLVRVGFSNSVFAFLREPHNIFGMIVHYFKVKMSNLISTSTNIKKKVLELFGIPSSFWRSPNQNNHKTKSLLLASLHHNLEKLSTMIDKLLMLFPTWNNIIPTSTVILFLLYLRIVGFNVNVVVSNNENSRLYGSSSRSTIIDVVEAFDVHMPTSETSTLRYTRSMMSPLTTTLKSSSLINPSTSSLVVYSRSFHGRLTNSNLHTCYYSTNSDQDTDEVESSMTSSSHLSPTSKTSTTSTAKPRSARKRTRYTIDDSVCPPTRPHTLENHVRRACQNFDTYHSRKPFANHTVEAYNALVERLSFDSLSLDLPSSREIRPVVLDSGCGTGRSTRHLATIFPNHWVIGVDRSFVRISRNKNKNITTISNQPFWNDDLTGRSHEYNDDGQKKKKKKENQMLQDSIGETLLDDREEDDVVGQDDDLVSFCSPSTSPERDFISQIAPNAFLVRAELVDFWRCCYQDRLVMTDDGYGDDHDDKSKRFKWNITDHYILYPNPYPKTQRLAQRWYCHPSFPLLMTLGTQQRIVIRSNWENYLREFATAVELATEFYDEEIKTKTNASDKIVTGMLTNPMSRYVESARVGPIERKDKELALTNFEAKYDEIGEATYELILGPPHTSEV